MREDLAAQERTARLREQMLDAVMNDEVARARKTVGEALGPED